MRLDGSRVYVATHWVLLADGARRLPSVIETHTDITARLRVQEELETAQRGG